MSLMFGPVIQLGVVVHDIEAAMQAWSKRLGIGPWIHNPDARFADFRLNGQPAAHPRLSIAVANSGPLQIELIQQHDDAPSIYRDFLRHGIEGQQHVAHGVTDFPASHAKILAAGWVEAQSGTSVGRLGYYTHPDMPDIVVELLEMNPARAGLFKKVEALAQAWDGTDPVRGVATLLPAPTAR